MCIVLLLAAFEYYGLCCLNKDLIVFCLKEYIFLQIIMEFDANNFIDEIIGIEFDVSPGENDSEKPDSITNKKESHVKRKRR